MRAVYTALIGEYEALKEQPTATTSSLPFICFTDNPGLTSKTWDVRLVQTDFSMDTVRSARSLKILGHPDLAAFEETLWIDNRVELLLDPDLVLDDWLDRSDFTLFEHSFRDRLLDEFYAIVTAGYDDPARVYEQLIHYSQTYSETLDQPPLWTGIMARRQTTAVQNAMRVWMDHVLRYSRRDQLSASVASQPLGDRQRRLVGDNLLSPWHSWPRLGTDQTLGRNTSIPRDAFVHAIRAPLSRLSEIEGPIQERIAGLTGSVRHQEVVIDEQRRSIDTLTKALEDQRKDGLVLSSTIIQQRKKIDRLKQSLNEQREQRTPEVSTEQADSYRSRDDGRRRFRSRGR